MKLRFAETNVYVYWNCFPQNTGLVNEQDENQSEVDQLLPLLIQATSTSNKAGGNMRFRIWHTSFLQK